jgi:hypothetical protein
VRTPPPPPKGGNPNGAFQKANREINFIVGGRQVTKSNRQTRSNAREIGHVNTKNPRPLWWSEFPITFFRKDHWLHIPDPGTYPLVVNPIVNGSWLPKTLIDGGSSLNIIFTETLRKMEFDFSKMTASDEPFYGVVSNHHPGVPSFLLFLEHQTSHAACFNARGLLYECVFDALLFSSSYRPIGKPISHHVVTRPTLFFSSSFLYHHTGHLSHHDARILLMSASPMPSEFFHHRFDLLEAYFL